MLPAKLNGTEPPVQKEVDRPGTQPANPVRSATATGKPGRKPAKPERNRQTRNGTVGTERNRQTRNATGKTKRNATGKPGTEPTSP